MSNVTEIRPATRRSRGARKAAAVPLKDIVDVQSGPLAEAEALADAMEVFATDNTQLRDNSLATLSHMLVERLEQVRDSIDAEVPHG